MKFFKLGSNNKKENRHHDQFMVENVQDRTRSWHGIPNHKRKTQEEKSYLIARVVMLFHK